MKSMGIESSSADMFSFSDTKSVRADDDIQKIAEEVKKVVSTKDSKFKPPINNLRKKSRPTIPNQKAYGLLKGKKILIQSG